ncbi:MAG: Gmad2 immunoglobulin-like domain-containing protein [Patescibacteria group bacterium]
MSKFSITILLLLLLLILGGLVFFAKNYNQLLVSPPPSATLVQSPTPQPIADLIMVDYPEPDSLVESPLLVLGQARGFWFFEASFPARLLDEDGNEIARGVAQADSPAGGEWMTEDFVPFQAELKFKTPDTETGTLVLEKDNPSGEAANAAELRIPVEF